MVTSAGEEPISKEMVEIVHRLPKKKLLWFRLYFNSYMFSKYGNGNVLFLRMGTGVLCDFKKIHSPVVISDP